MDESFPAFAQRVTVLGSTRNNFATSEGVSSWPVSVALPSIMRLLHVAARDITKVRGRMFRAPLWAS